MWSKSLEAEAQCLGIHGAELLDHLDRSFEGHEEYFGKSANQERDEGS
jgi:hypothetical protein